ncbi:MAG: phosphoglycerate kinase [Chloroflexi bacterium]|nr:phosphoglycerate kinase [Chloroflexota bacterium]
MFNKKTVRDIDAQGKRVLVRVDFNVPLAEGQVSDDTRIRAAIPTIEHLRAQRATVILCSHLGRPKGEVRPEFSLHPVSQSLAALLNTSIGFAEDCIGPIAEAASSAAQPGEILLLENTRFHPGEQDNDPEMARQLATLADIFVNDAFGTAHRAHASTEGVAHLLPAVAGLLMEKEIRYLGEAVAAPEHPFIAILGGAKISGKINVIHNLLDKADKVLVGGGMANTFIKAQGHYVGESLVEDNSLETARQLLEKDAARLSLPTDIVIADDFTAEAKSQIIPVGDVPEGWRIMDIGPQTVAAYTEELQGAGTVVWNGPMGVFEFPAFAEGTNQLAQAIAESGAITIVGGGESVAAIRQAGLAEQITHISTGGGAALEMLEGKTLPGLAALLDK